MHCSQITIPLSCWRSLSGLSLLPLFRCSGCFRWRRHLWPVVCLNNNLVFCFPFSWLFICSAKLNAAFEYYVYPCASHVCFAVFLLLFLPACPTFLQRACICLPCPMFSPLVFVSVVAIIPIPQFAGLALMRNYVIALLSCCSCVWVCKCAFFNICKLRVNCQRSEGINCYYDYAGVIRFVGLQLSL